MIWLVGANGMLGQQLAEALRDGGLDFVGTDRETDFTSLDVLRNFVKGRSFDWIVNCAAYTAVDKAEDDRERCRALNAEGPRNLGTVASQMGARVLHVSTDYVFDGHAERPYLEDDPIRPLTVYGQTKAEGESLLFQTCPRSVILRTAWLYGQHGPNFVATMLRLMKERDSLGVVADQYGAPTWAADLAQVMVAVIRNPPIEGGVFHASGEGQTTWHAFAVAIADEARVLGLLDAKRPLDIKPLSTAEYPTKAHRPQWSVLSKEKLKRVLGLEFPPWRDSLHRYLQAQSREAKGTQTS